MKNGGGHADRTIGDFAGNKLKKNEGDYIHALTSILDSKRENEKEIEKQKNARII